MQAVRVAGRVAGKATTACAPVQRRRHITVGALATSGDVVLVQNDTPVPCEYSSSTVWLAASPRGSYTTGRTVGRSSIFEFPFHVQRLVTSTKLMLRADADTRGLAPAAFPAHLAPLLDVEQLEPLVLKSLRSAMERYTAAGEVKLTVLVTWDDESFDIWSHLVPLPPLPSPPVRVLVNGSPRSNAAAKDSDWVRARKVLEDGMPAGVNEIVLCDELGALLEGMSSNFFVVLKDDTLVTADAGVLPGTVREVLLQVCEAEGIPVRLQPPMLADVDQWEGALVSSTSRLALPVDRITLPAADGGGERTVEFTASPVTRRIAALVQDAIAANSTLVF